MATPYRPPNHLDALDDAELLLVPFPRLVVIGDGRPTTGVVAS